MNPDAYARRQARRTSGMVPQSRRWAVDASALSNLAWLPSDLAPTAAVAFSELLPSELHKTTKSSRKTSQGRATACLAPERQHSSNRLSINGCPASPKR